MLLDASYAQLALSNPSRVYWEPGPCLRAARHRRTRWLLAASGYHRATRRDSSRNQSQPYHVRSAFRWAASADSGWRLAAMSERLFPYGVGDAREIGRAQARRNCRSVRRDNGLAERRQSING